MECTHNGNELQNRIFGKAPETLEKTKHEELNIGDHFVDYCSQEFSLFSGKHYFAMHPMRM